jgi:hypothetical protein
VQWDEIRGMENEKQLDAVKEILQRISLLEAHLTQKENKSLVPISNEEFIKLMGVSRRTAQTWRDLGKIEFIQIGKKIFYSQEAIKKFTDSNIRATF